MALLCLISVLLLAPSHISASWNEPDGFRSLKWGSGPEQLREQFPGMSTYPIESTTYQGQTVETYAATGQLIGNLGVDIYLTYLDKQLARSCKDLFSFRVL